MAGLEERQVVTGVVRPAEVEESRVKLPAFGCEQELVHSVVHNLVTVVTGGTGCGKSTQVPQFLLEAGFNYEYAGQRLLVGVTQPRRVATRAVANRVRYELGNYGRYVAYQVRHEYSTAAEELLRFMTDGVLLKIVQHDFLLRNFSVIVLDEIHERSANCDILLGILSRVVRLRHDLHQQKKPTFRH